MRPVLGWLGVQMLPYDESEPPIDCIIMLSSAPTYSPHESTAGSNKSRLHSDCKVGSLQLGARQSYMPQVLLQRFAYKRTPNISLPRSLPVLAFLSSFCSPFLSSGPHSGPVTPVYTKSESFLGTPSRSPCRRPSSDVPRNLSYRIFLRFYSSIQWIQRTS